MEEYGRQAVEGEKRLEWALVRVHSQTLLHNQIHTLLHINSVSTGSDSPMYSVIFLLIHGPTRFSTSV